MFSCVDTLLRGCRLRRRIFDPDDVILGVVGLSRDSYAGARSRSLTGPGARRTLSAPSTRRDSRNSRSLVRVDSGLAGESVCTSPSSTDDVRDELIVPPAPVMSLDSSLDAAAQRFAVMNASFDANGSYEDARRATGGDEKENRAKWSESGSKTKKKKKKKKKATKKEQKWSGERLGAGDGARDEAGSSPRHAGSSCDAESLWDVNGVKLWRLCAEMLACSSSSSSSSKQRGADVVDTAPQPRRTGQSVRSPREYIVILTETSLSRVSSGLTRPTWIPRTVY